MADDAAAAQHAARFSAVVLRLRHEVPAQTAEQRRQEARLRRHRLLAPFAGVISAKLVEEGETNQIFTNPTHQLTENYITGRFG